MLLLWQYIYIYIFHNHQNSEEIFKFRYLFLLIIRREKLLTNEEIYGGEQERGRSNLIHMYDIILQN